MRVLLWLLPALPLLAVLLAGPEHQKNQPGRHDLPEQKVSLSGAQQEVRDEQNT